MATDRNWRKWALKFNDPDDNYTHELEVKSKEHFSQVSIENKASLLIWILDAFENSNLKIKNWNVVSHILIIEHEKYLTSEKQ